MRFLIYLLISLGGISSTQATQYMFRTEPEKAKIIENESKKNIQNKNITQQKIVVKKEKTSTKTNFILLKGAKGAGRTCFSILQDNNDSKNGIYTISPSEIPLNVYCDMTNGGWSLLAVQNENELFTKNIYSINENNFGKLNETFRVGNEIINSIRPYFSWKITDNTNEVYFNPNCIINWGNNLNDTNFSFCNQGYKDQYFKDKISDYTASNYTNGIGMSNEGKYCSIRMYLSRDIFDRDNNKVITKGTAFNCSGSTEGIIRLWFK
jgi:hypothetical protein